MDFQRNGHGRIKKVSAEEQSTRSNRHKGARAPGCIEEHNMAFPRHVATNPERGSEWRMMPMSALRVSDWESKYFYKGMDWQGQQLAEQIMQYALLAAALVAFMAGYIMGSFQLMIQVYGVLVLVVLLVVVPDWGYFNRHPIEWLDPQIAAESTPKSKPPAPSKKPAKASKK